MDENGSSETVNLALGTAPVDEIDGGVASCIRGSKEEDLADKFERKLNLGDSGKYAEYYNMNYKYNGYLMIFAHENFTVGRKCARPSVAEDVHMLKESFTALNFKVVVYPNLRLQELKNLIEKTTSMDFGNYGSLAVAVSSHGDDSGNIFARDGTYDPNTVLIDPFTRVETLYGKPKMFFLEFCRGKAVDDGYTLLSQVDTDGYQLEEFTIPQQADFLIVYATLEGYVAFHNEVDGSQFFIYLCRAFDEMANSRDVLTILTLANQRLSIDFSSKNYETPEHDNKKQCMCVMHTLTRILFFNV